MISPSSRRGERPTQIENPGHAPVASFRNGTYMVLIFFCVSGVIGAIDRHPSITTRENEPEASRSLESDASLFARTIEPFPGALVVIANDWPLLYDLEVLRQECAAFAQRIVNAVRTLGGTKEEAVLGFLSSLPAEYVVVASPDFEFSDVTAARRVNVDSQFGFDAGAADRLRVLLEKAAEAATHPVSADDIMRATAGNPWVRRLQTYLAHSRQRTI